MVLYAAWPEFSFSKSLFSSLRWSSSSLCHCIIEKFHHFVDTSVAPWQASLKISCANESALLNVPGCWSSPLMHSVTWNPSSCAVWGSLGVLRNALRGFFVLLRTVVLVFVSVSKDFSWTCCWSACGFLAAPVPAHKCHSFCWVSPDWIIWYWTCMQRESWCNVCQLSLRWMADPGSQFSWVSKLFLNGVYVISAGGLPRSS